MELEMTKQTKDKERRQFRRIVFTLDDGIVGLLDPPGVKGGQPITAQVLNLSEGGLQLTFNTVLKQRIKEGDRLLLTEIRGVDAAEVIVNVDTEVRWISRSQLSEKIGLGCEFKNLLKDAKQKINKIIEFWYLQRIQADETGNQKKE
jgi:c-di-GMP-binding flagellar brake protein YcgR